MLIYLTMRKLLPIFLLLPLLAANGIDLPERYQPGEVVHYSVERDDKVIGSQEARCLGWQVVESESLYVFEMKSKLMLLQLGRKVEVDIVSNPAYRRDGLPRHYSYKIETLGRTIEHRGLFTGRDYYGYTTRFGVEKPFNMETPSWPVLLDSHFGLQWEIAAARFDFSAGDTAKLQAMVPQIDRLVELEVTRERPERVDFENQSTPVLVYDVFPANQVFYIDGDGRLLKAYDSSQRLTVRRLGADEKAEIATTPLIDKLYSRAPSYAVLLAFGLAWLALIAQKRFLQWRVLLFFLLGALLYWPALKILAYASLLFENFFASPAAPRTGSSMMLFGLALLFALVEELVKFIPIWLNWLASSGKRVKLLLAVGAACGAGFGFAQGTNLSAFAPDGSFLLPLELWQRLFVVGLHAGTGALLALLLFMRKPPLYYLIPLGAKTLVGWLYSFVQKGLFGLGTYALLAAIVCTGILVVIYIFYRSVAVNVAPRSRRRAK